MISVDVRKLIKSFGYAFIGMLTATKQQNMRIHLISAIVVIIAALLTGISAMEWILLVVVIALVIGMEMVNTAIEAIVDLVSPNYHPLAKVAKDVAAGAVLIVAIASVVIGCIIFIPKWF